MNKIAPRLPPKTAKIINLVHDEIDLLVHETQVQAVKEIIGTGFHEAFRELFGDRLKVKFKIGTGQSWAEAKVPLVVRFVEELFISGSGKVVLFCHHRDVLSQLEMQLVGYGPVGLHGGTSTKGRAEAVERFQNDPYTKVFIGNITAAGVGITLAPASSHCIFAELSWVPAEMTQAEDRLHRIGARNHVLVQHLVLEGSLDVRRKNFPRGYRVRRPAVPRQPPVVPKSFHALQIFPLFFPSD